MKRMFTLALVLAFMLPALATVSTEPPVRKADQYFIPIGGTGHRISLLELSRISVKDFEAVSGRDMKFTEKVTFKLAQRKIRHSIAEDGTVNHRGLEKVMKQIDGTTGFHLGGFALGFLLGLIGVLVAYLIKDEKKPNRTKWSWIGLAGALVLFLLVL